MTDENRFIVEPSEMVDESRLENGESGQFDPEEDEISTEDREYVDALAPVDEKKVGILQQQLNSDGTLKQLFRARPSDFVSTLIHLDGKNFSFSGRGYLRPAYDRDDPSTLFKTARQVEKCQPLGSLVSKADGTLVAIESLRKGDKVVGMFIDGKQAGVYVGASEPNGCKPCLRIKTRLGSNIVVTKNHPLRTFDGWALAENLSTGRKLASLRSIGSFGNLNEPRAAILGLIVGDGSFLRHATSDHLSFCVADAAVELWFRSLAGDALRATYPKKGSCAKDVRLSPKSELANWFRLQGLYNKRSWEKVLPSVVFQYDEASTRELLRGLWATDGHCKNVSKSKVDLVYCSTSKALILQIQALLRKFGIVTTRREYKPKGGRLAYIIRVVTRKSLEAFYTRIGPIPGKPFELPTCATNSNLDTLPIEAQEEFRRCRKLNGDHWSRHGLGEHGLRQAFKYCPTYEKAAALQKFVQSPLISWALASDIIWDEIVSIEDVGEQETWAISTTNETYISENLVNHNSTFLANKLVVTSVVNSFQKSLYVSPSHMQTRQFSSEKLKPVIEKSPLIRTYFQDSSISNQVFEKGFTNGSFIFLRSAFRSADRTRGISCSGELTLDELQDMVTSEIPVIMECTSHYPDAKVRMAGTPKTLDNTLEIYWQETTQNEWLVRCDACGKWNFLDEDCIAPTKVYLAGDLPPGPICKACEKPLRVMNGRWISTASGKSIVGYRIPQLMVPWIVGLDSQWRKLLWKRDNYGRGQFYNEVLGLSYDSASKPITRTELMACCGDYKLWNPNELHKHVAEAKKCILFAGIDWGEGNDGSERSPSGKIRTASYTVLTIGYYANQKDFHVKLIKKYTGRETEPEHVVNDICRICQTLGVALVGVDWGHGWGVNNLLVRKLGPSNVVQYQYLPKLKPRMRWDPTGWRYHLLRNFMMSELFFDMKQKMVVFPTWEDFQPYAADILNIYTEYSEFRREIKYDHRPSDPDDGFHSLLYSKLSADIYFKKSRRFTLDVVNESMGGF